MENLSVIEIIAASLDQKSQYMQEAIKIVNEKMAACDPEFFIMLVQAMLSNNNLEFRQRASIAAKNYLTSKSQTIQALRAQIWQNLQQQDQEQIISECLSRLGEEANQIGNFLGAVVYSSNEDTGNQIINAAIDQINDNASRMNVILMLQQVYSKSQMYQTNIFPFIYESLQIADKNIIFHSLQLILHINLENITPEIVNTLIQIFQSCLASSNFKFLCIIYEIFTQLTNIIPLDQIQYEDQSLIVVMMDFCLLNVNDFQLKQNELQFLKTIFVSEKCQEVYGTDYPVKILTYLVENLQKIESYDEITYIEELKQLFETIYGKFTQENKNACLDYIKQLPAFQMHREREHVLLFLNICQKIPELDITDCYYCCIQLLKSDDELLIKNALQTLTALVKNKKILPVQFASLTNELLQFSGQLNEISNLIKELLQQGARIDFQTLFQHFILDQKFDANKFQEIRDLQMFEKLFELADDSTVYIEGLMNYFIKDYQYSEETIYHQSLILNLINIALFQQDCKQVSRKTDCPISKLRDLSIDFMNQLSNQILQDDFRLDNICIIISDILYIFSMYDATKMPSDFVEFILNTVSNIPKNEVYTQLIYLLMNLNPQQTEQYSEVLNEMAMADLYNTSELYLQRLALPLLFQVQNYQAFNEFFTGFYNQIINQNIQVEDAILIKIILDTVDLQFDLFDDFDVKAADLCLKLVTDFTPQCDLDVAISNKALNLLSSLYLRFKQHQNGYQKKIAVFVHQNRNRIIFLLSKIDGTNGINIRKCQFWAVFGVIIDKKE